MITTTALLATVETILACLALSFAVSCVVGFAIRAGGPATMARAAVSYRLAAGAALRRPGERYIGSLADEGRIAHLYYVANGFIGDWRDASAWAARHGADLPTVDELSLLRIQAPDVLAAGVYWTSDTRDDSPAWAITVDSGSGRISDEHIGVRLNAVAVRRVVV